MNADDNSAVRQAVSETVTVAEDSGAARRRRARTPRLYRVCDGITEGLIYLGVVFTPWAFGTTQNWSIWTMNVVCYLLGVALIMKWVIRWRTGYAPPRWGDQLSVSSGQLAVAAREDQGSEGSCQLSVVSCQTKKERRAKIGRVLTRALAGLTVLILVYVFISAVNARARFVWEELRFDYFESYVPWLPHSYDSGSTWEVFWQYLGLAFFFWATRDWLLGKTRSERREGDQGPETKNHGPQVSGRVERGLEADVRGPASGVAAGTSVFADRALQVSRSHDSVMPARLRRLLWVLSINGAMLALEGVLQRLDGTDKLLWVVRPTFAGSESMFGSYAYRSNAAQYLNLSWPITLVLFLWLRKTVRVQQLRRPTPSSGSYALLIPCVVLTASAPIISTSRGGAIIAISQIILGCPIILLSLRREHVRMRVGLLLVLVASLGFAAYLGGTQLAKRLEDTLVGGLGGRSEIYTNSRSIPQQFPIFGTGPGTFAPIYRLYKDPNQTWEAYLHDDWLETRINFGLVGSSVIFTLLGIALFRWCLPDHGIACPWELAACSWLAVAGCLMHAKFDFPLQVYSILLLFLLVCAILSSSSRK